MFSQNGDFQSTLIWDPLFVSLLTFFFFFGLFRAVTVAYGGSQARGRIGTVATSLYHCHSNARSEPCLQTIPQLMAMLDP